jgi:hypothetical protein
MEGPDRLRKRGICQGGGLVVRAARSGDLRPPPPTDSSTHHDAQRQLAATLAWGRDPFARGAAAGQPGGLSLSGILWDATSPIAIINGQMFRVGEEIDGFRVLEIAHDRVSLSDGTQTFQLLIAP